MSIRLISCSTVMPDVGMVRPLSTWATSFASSLSAFAPPRLVLGARTVA